MGKLRVAIVGVGNCASSLVQGVHFYAGAEPVTRSPG
jgi:myo-inositol-1-phosphate synthase